MTVTLEWYELLEAAQVGCLRHVEAIRRAMRRQDGTVPCWAEDVEGAAAERAVAKHLGLYWSGSINGLDLPDVGPLGVRYAADPSLSLIVRDRDIEKHGAGAIFVSVTGRRGRYEVRGWITAGECRDEWRRDPHGWGAAWFVPARELHPIDQINGATGVAQEEYTK